MRFGPSTVDANHPDFLELTAICSAIQTCVGKIERLQIAFPQLVRDSVDFVLDPIKTARTRIFQLDNVEKTFIGLKVEHALRDFLDIPKGLRDLVVNDLDVDIKNTVVGNWMIPPETYSVEGYCLMVAIDEERGLCWLGAFKARPSYLNRPNRDMKRSVSSSAFSNIMWLLYEANIPSGPWMNINMDRFRELRKVRGGTNRAVLFFKENLGKPIGRAVVQALLYDQEDYMKRLRANGGARDKLSKEGVLLLSGVYDQKAILNYRLPITKSDEMIAVNKVDL